MTEKQTKNINDLLNRQANDRRNARLQKQRAEQYANESPEEKAERLAGYKKNNKLTKKRLDENPENKKAANHRDAKSRAVNFINKKATLADLEELAEIIEKKLKNL